MGNQMPAFAGDRIQKAAGSPVTLKIKPGTDGRVKDQLRMQND